MFNPKTKNTVRSKVGNIAYSQKAKDDLTDYIMTEMFRPKYYGNDALQDIPKLFTQINDKDFLYKALVFGRNVGGLREVSALLAALLAIDKRFKSDPIKKEVFLKAIKRPDDMLKTWGAIKHLTGTHYIPKAYSKACAKALERMDYYQLKKYASNSKEFKLKDLVKMVHPDPRKSKTGDLDVFKKVIEDRLPKIQTAQTINASGKENRIEKYKEVIKQGKLGTLALLRNLAKLYKKDRELSILIQEQLKDIDRANKAMVMPIDMFKAYLACKQEGVLTKKLRGILLDLFVKRSKEVNIVEPTDRPVVLIDGSGSMYGYPMENAVVTAMQLVSAIPQTRVVIFADTWAEITPYTYEDVFEWFERNFKNGGWGLQPKVDVGYATYIEEALNVIYDKETTHIFILSDMQLYGRNSIDKPLQKYTNMKDFKKVVLWDMNPYTRGKPFNPNSDKVISLAGYSDKLVEFLPILMKTGKNLSSIIENYEIF